MMEPLGKLPADYPAWLSQLKRRIQGARQRAVLAVNAEQIRLYHELGQEIAARQSQQGWGAKVIERLSADLREAFPEMKGWSVRNLKYMKVFAESCPDLQFGQQSAAQLPWFHIVTLLTKLTDPEQRSWYAMQAVEQGWSRDTLQAQIRSQLHLRQGRDRPYPGHAGEPPGMTMTIVTFGGFHFHRRAVMLLGNRTRQGYARKRILKLAGHFLARGEQ